MSTITPALMIVDYNLTRLNDVSQMRNYAWKQHKAKTFLIRATPGPQDKAICDQIFAADPQQPNFVENALKSLGHHRDEIVAGLVFSDDAVHCGAELLEHLYLSGDSSTLAVGAFNKYVYRLSERKHQAELESQQIMVPDFAEISTMDDLLAFSALHSDGFVIKPKCEGNNRGVMLVTADGDKQAAFNEVLPYLEKGVICEQIIPYRREYSFDGLAQLHFITEKISVHGRFPVEIAQVLPARLTDIERATIVRTGHQVNRLIGQRVGPFHNEIKLSDDGLRSAVVEPNRRPGGMKIWSLAKWVYQIDLYESWVDSVFSIPPPTILPPSFCSAATVMLGVYQDIEFSPEDIKEQANPCEEAIAATATSFGLTPQELVVREFNWLSQQRRMIHQEPRDNADFVAMVCVTLSNDRIDIRDVVRTLQEKWLLILNADLVYPIK